MNAALGVAIDYVLNGARKATGAFVVAAVGAIGASALDGALTGPETVAAFGAGAVAFAAVLKLQNTGEHAPGAGQHRAEG